MKQKTEASHGAWRFAILYAVCLLILLSVTTVTFLQTLRRSSGTQPPAETEEIYVYLPQDSETDPKEPEIIEKEESEEYLVKEYRGQIGIFSTDGTLLEVLDTYVKTLPEADRALLGEGISVKTKAELNSLIEDYSH